MSDAAHYIPPPPTTVDLDWADLPIIDLSQRTTPEGNAKVALQVRDALTTHGFFYVINHGYTKAQTERIFDIANIPFTQMTEEEKKDYPASFSQVTGLYQGFKPRQYFHLEGGIRDQFEEYTVARGGTTTEAHPNTLRPFLPELVQFMEHNHSNVLEPLLRYLALGLELPEDDLLKLHGPASAGESVIRFIKYYPRTEDEETKTKNVWIKGHTDFGSITMLYSQPVSGLQILTSDGSWKWVKHIENALVINAGDALEFLSGGFYRATIHRVIQPAEDQRGLTRLSLVYFARPDDDIKLVPLAQSPVLQRSGIKKLCEDHEAPTMGMWRTGRTAAYGLSKLKKSTTSGESGVEEEIISGVRVKHYS